MSEGSGEARQHIRKGPTGSEPHQRKENPVGRILQQSLILHVAVMSLLIWVGITGIREQGWLENIELDAYDWSLRLRPARSGPPPPITLVAITDEDIRKLGRWPVTDRVLAKALDNIMQQKPRAVGVDMYRDLEVPPGRQELNRVLTAHPEIMMVMKFGGIETGGILPPPVLRGTDQVGFSDIVVDADGVVRRGLLYLDDGTDFANSLSLGLTLKYGKEEGIVPKPAPENPDWMKLGKTVFRPLESHDGSYIEADAQGYQYLLDLERRDQHFARVSFGEVLAGTVQPEMFRDKIVLVGVDAQGVKDYFYTSQCGRWGTCPQLSGIELHAYLVWQLLRASQQGQAPFTTLSDAQENGWLALWIVAGAIIGVWVRGAWRFSVVLLMGIVGLGGLVIGGVVQGIWMPFIPPALGLTVNAMLVTAYMSNREKNDRRVLMSLFSRHVSSEVAKDIWKRREQLLDNGRLRPQKVVVTTLFSDLEGFTTIAEGMEPQTLLSWLNTYMEAMVDIIERHGGVVDDYYGDMIKAGFGVFTQDQTEEDILHQAQQAVGCAMAMEREMIRLNEEWQQQGLPTVRMRVGINTGPVVAGSLGSAQRLKFTTIGDSVNVAARLESFEKASLETWAKEDVCRILVGELTKQYLGNHQWTFKEVGVVTLKGKSVESPVYRLVTPRKD